MSDAAPSPEIRAEAATWLARLRADDRSPSDEAAFQVWLGESPAHAAAFEAVDQVWSEVGGLSEQSDPRRPGVYGEPARKRVASRRAIMAGAGLFVIAGASTAFWKNAQAKVYQTDVGEQKHVSLDDGSQLFLDAQTRIAVAFTATERTVDMAYGRANFRVAPDSARPFVVEAAEQKIIATQCSFDVRCQNGQVQVVLIHGEADVRPAASPGAQGNRLTSGERLVAANDLEKRDKPDMTRLTAWQVGYEMFENEKLSQAVEEMNRYSTQRLEVDASTADLKVSGVYRVGDNSAFARALSQLLPITVRQTDDVLLLTAESGQ